MRRVACIALPQVRVEIAREISEEPWGEHRVTSRESPLAIVIGRPGGGVKMERDVLGNTRLDVVSREARVLGVRSGQTVAAARAKCAALRVRVVAESAVRTALSRVAEVALAFGPTVAFDVVTDVVWIEIGGCAHLYGGERALALALGERVRALGHACRVSIADGPRIASAMARFAPSSRTSDNASFVVPEGKGADAMRILPLEVLSLEKDCIRWLKDLGLSTCGDLQNLPRRGLGTRLGARTKDVMQLLNGEDLAPLVAWRPPEVPEERIELEWGASSVEALWFVTRALCDRLAPRLEGRGVAAMRVGLMLTLDRALLCEGVVPVAAFDLALPVPIARASDLFAVLRARLEHFELAAPVLAVTLRALEIAPATPWSLDLLEPEPKIEGALSPLVAELAADLGGTSVGTLSLVDTWSPEERTRLVPFGATRGMLPTSALVTSAMEPSRLVQPLRMPPGTFDEATPIFRLEAVEWWRGSVQNSDFCAVWDGFALAWIERRAAHGLRAHETWLRGWID
jgi:protein ImuB